MLRQIKIQLPKTEQSRSRYLEMNFVDDDGVEHVITRKTKKLMLKSQQMPSDEVETIKLQVGGAPYIIKFDDESSDPVDLMNARKAQLLSKHRHVKVVKHFNSDGMAVYDGDANPNMLVHQFDFVDETATHILNVMTLKRFLKNMNVVNSMTMSQKADVLYFFGVNPQKMKHSEMLMRLADPGGGIVVSRSQYDTVKEGKNIRARSFMDVFAEVYDSKSQTIYYETLIKKALLIKKDDIGRTILERRKDGAYYMNEEQLGMSISDVVQRMVGDAKVLDYVRREVEKNDDLMDDDIPTLLSVKGFKEVAGDMVELSKKAAAEQGADDYQERKSLMEMCTIQFKMQLDPETPTERLKELKADGMKFFQGVKRFGFTKLFNSNPHWTWDEMVEEYNKGMAVKHGKPRKDYLAARLAETARQGVPA